MQTATLTYDNEKVVVTYRVADVLGRWKQAVDSGDDTKRRRWEKVLYDMAVTIGIKPLSNSGD